ncbi:MAG: ABC transporter permease [Nitrososphaerota archaeon]
MNLEKIRRKISINLLYSLPAIIYLTIFFYIPLITIIVYSFWHGEPLYRVVRTFTLENYVKFYTEELSQNIFILTNLISIATFLVILATAYPIAYFLARMVKGDTGLKIILLILIPLEMNYLIRVFAWRNLLGENGLLNSLLMFLGLVEQPLTIFFHSIPAIIIVVLHNALPYAIIPLYITIRSIPESLYQAAMDLGSNRISVFFRVTLPLSMPGVAIAFLFIYIPMMGEFAIPALVGGKTYLLGNLIVRQYLTIGNWPYASASTISLILTTLIVMFILFKFLGVRRLYE